MEASMGSRGISALLLGGLFLAPVSGAMGQSANVAYAPAASPKTEYVVFIDNGSSQLSSAASATVRRAAAAARSAKVVQLVGRADHVEAVKQQLVRDGVPERAIVVHPQSTRPIVRAGDGINDPLNRRVEIAF
jgi:outer membrane protein OmpA-like peptidoglycan-associated protein